MTDARVFAAQVDANAAALEARVHDRDCETYWIGGSQAGGESRTPAGRSGRGRRLTRKRLGIGRGVTHAGSAWCCKGVVGGTLRC